MWARCGDDVRESARRSRILEPGCLFTCEASHLPQSGTRRTRVGARERERERDGGPALSISTDVWWAVESGARGCVRTRVLTLRTPRASGQREAGGAHGERDGGGARPQPPPESSGLAMAGLALRWMPPVESACCRTGQRSRPGSRSRTRTRGATRARKAVALDGAVAALYDTERPAERTGGVGGGGARGTRQRWWTRRRASLRAWTDGAPGVQYAVGALDARSTAMRGKRGPGWRAAGGAVQPEVAGGRLGARARTHVT